MLNLFRTKSVDKMLQNSEEGGQHKLKRALTAFDITIMGIGAIIGAGIFVLTGTAAATHAGPGIILSFVFTGIACAFTALCYAEFASMIPIAGSAYTYSYATLGELIAWIIGWDLILEYAVGACAVSIGWSSYFVDFLKKFFNIDFPVAFSMAPNLMPGTTTYINLPAVLVILAMTALLVIGIKESAKFNNVVVVIKILIICFFLYVGAVIIKINPANWKPFMPFGWHGVMAGAALVFFAYIGFDSVTTTAEEAKKPQRDLPIGIIASLIICTVLYVAVAAVLTGITHYTKLNNPAPIAVALIEAGKAKLSGVVSVGAVVSLLSTMLVMLMAQPRIFFAMSRDGLLPQGLSKVHKKFGTPYITTILTGVVVAAAAGFGNIQTVAELCNIGTLFAFVLVCVGIIVLRRTKPDLKRPFKCPAVPLIPILGALSCIYLMCSLPLTTWIRFIVWMLIGIVIYFLYGAKNSKIGKES